MFGNMFGGIKEKQALADEELRKMRLEEEVDGGAIKLVFDGKGEWKDISIAPTVLKDADQLEDLLISLAGKVQSVALEKQQVIQQKMLQDILPGGMGLDSLKDLF